MVIPARYGSTRFPAKILASETGKPLVQHVVERVRQCRRVRAVLVATDDQRIIDALSPFETRCIMTSPTHQSGTDRIAEVARDLSDEIVVNVQGDEPEIEPAIVDALIDRLEMTPTGQMVTAATAFPAGADPSNPNLVKVVVNLNGQAIYFSRAPIPYPREQNPFVESGAAGPSLHFLHLGIYAYRREFLLKFAAWTPTRLEIIEGLEQLRALEHGCPIYVLKVDRATHGIDTPEQYAEFVRRTSLAKS